VSPFLASCYGVCGPKKLPADLLAELNTMIKRRRSGARVRTDHAPPNIQRRMVDCSAPQNDHVIVGKDGHGSFRGLKLI
jgi:hypothetical protein